MHELMRCRSTAEKRAVIYAHMPRQQTIVRDNDVVSDDAIVSYMRTGHQEIFIPDLGDCALRAAAVDRAVFADNVVVSNLHSRVSFRRERNVLRRRANHRAVSDKIAAADYDLSFNYDVRPHNCPLADHCMWSNHRKRTDLDINANARVQIDNRRRMNLRVAHLVRISIFEFRISGYSTPASLKLK